MRNANPIGRVASLSHRTLSPLTTVTRQQDNNFTISCMLQHIKLVRVAFSPFDPRSKSVREFLRRISANKILDTNRKAKIETTVREDYGKNTVDIEFNNGNTLNLVTCDMIAEEILEEVELVSAAMN